MLAMYKTYNMHIKQRIVLCLIKDRMRIDMKDNPIDDLNSSDRLTVTWLI